MKKSITIFCVIFSLLLIGGCTADTISDEEKSVLYWIPEQSKFIDYEIVDNKIIFSYSICFVNDSQEVQTVSLAAKFKSKELKGWIRNRGFFLGTNENGEMLSEKISPRTKKSIAFYFEGEYLGGTVNKELSFPYEIILMS